MKKKAAAVALIAGHKEDSEKIRFDLLSATAIEELARVLTAGASKYADENWRKGINMKRLIGASYRHLNAIHKGKDIDPEFGLMHAAHLMCCAMFMCEQSMRAVYNSKFDDRYRIVLAEKK